MFYKSRKSPGRCNGIGGGKIEDNNWGHDCSTLTKQFSSVDIPLENGHGDMNYLGWSLMSDGHELDNFLGSL